MTKKHILIEILPRALWIIQGIVLFLAHHYLNYNPVINDNYFLLVSGFFLVLVGIIYLIIAFRFLAKAMFTKELITSGPYKYSRHPIYVAIYLILIGVGILFFSNLWFLILLIFIPFWYFDCKLEEKQMTDLYGQKYLDYKTRVRMFFPH